MSSFVAPARTVVQATPRTRIITVDVSGVEFVFRAGQAVRAGLADGVVTRPYSIACSPSHARRSGAIELLVQIDDHAAPDPHLERARPGTPLRIEGPFGEFALPWPLETPQLLMIAGGTGIAPLRAMLWEALERDAAADITLVYSARSADEFAYGEELQMLAERGRLALTLTITRPHEGRWDGSRGRIDQRLIASALKSTDTYCVLCGPAGLVADARQLLRAHGIAENRILRETYAA